MTYTWALATVLILVAGTAADDAADKELGKLQGTWILHSRHINGLEVRDAPSETFRMVIKGDKFTSLRNKDAELEGTLKLDPAQDPKHLNLLTLKVNGKPIEERSTKGLYKLEGDTLTWVVPLGRARPRELEPAEGTLVHVYKREKKE